jgi:hypothetical protein
MKYLLNLLITTIEFLINSFQSFLLSMREAKQNEYSINY